MEVIFVPQGGLKIKSKNTSFSVNPTGKFDSDVVVLTSKPASYSAYDGKLVIDGPGDYEVAGVSIKGESLEGKLAFDFLEDNQKLLVLPSSAAKDSETEDTTATVLLMDEKVDGALTSVVSEIIAVVGNEEFLPQDRATLKKMDKINLKKTEEYKGFVIHLAK